MRRIIQSLLAVVLASAGALAISTPARAECPFFVIPPATEAAQSAREIIVGTVIENVGGKYSDFRLRIDHVLRGPAKVGEIRRFNEVWPGWPLIETTDGRLIGPFEPLRAAAGNVIALSLDAFAPDGRTRYNAESWLTGRLPYNEDEPMTTLAQMQRLAGLPETDTKPLPTMEAHSPVPGHVELTIFGAAIVSLVAFATTRALSRPQRCREHQGTLAHAD